jgi:hypothetical protein
MGGRQTGTAWVRGALQRLIGETPDLRKGLRTPEEVPADEALPMIERLTQTFRKQIDPRTQRTSFVLQKPTLVIDGGVAGVARTGGAVAALYDATRRTAEQALSSLERITPLDSCADTTEVRSTMAIIKSTLEALVVEVQQEPRAFQMDNLFRALLDDVVVARGDAVGYIGHFQRIAGLSAANIRLTADFEQYSRFLLVRDSVQCLRESWNHWKRDDRSGELGMQYVRATWLFQAVRETVACYRTELEEVCLGDATLRSMPVMFKKTELHDDDVDVVSVGGFFDILDREPARWSRMLAEGGTVSVAAILSSVENINNLVTRAIDGLAHYADLVSHPPSRPDRPAKYKTDAGATPRTEYELLKIERLRTAQDLALRLRALLQEIENELRRPEQAPVPPAEQKAI